MMYEHTLDAIGPFSLGTRTNIKKQGQRDFNDKFLKWNRQLCKFFTKLLLLIWRSSFKLCCIDAKIYNTPDSRWSELIKNEKS